VWNKHGVRISGAGAMCYVT